MLTDLLTGCGEFMKLLLSLSFSGTILFSLVFLLLLPCRNRLSRRWQYDIWLFVALRFLVPFSMGGSLVGTLFLSVEEHISVQQSQDAEPFMMAEENQEPQQHTESVWNQEPQQHTESAWNQEAEPYTDAEWFAGTDAGAGTKQPGAVRTRGVSPVGACLFLIWAAAALILLLRKILSYQSYLHFVRTGNREVTDPEVRSLLFRKAQEMKIRRPIGLYQNRFLISPMMTGFFHPQILLPASEETKETLSYVFAHELTHYKYFDLFFKWLVQILLCIHWFNPIVYLLERQIGKNCELACDEKVIRTMGAAERKKYGDTLLTFLHAEEPFKSPLVSNTLTEGAGQLIERLGAIMDYKKKSVKMIFVTVLLTIGIVLCSSTLGVYAGQEKKDLVSDDLEGLSPDFSEDSYDLLYDEEDNAYYVLTDGAAMEDKPTGGFVGGVGIVLVRKSGYTSLGPFSSVDNFPEEVKKECKAALGKGMLSQKEVSLICKVAEDIAQGEFSGSGDEEWRGGTEKKDIGSYSYIQNSFYRAPYIVELGWNMKAEWVQEESARTELVLDNGQRITAFFSPEIRKYAADKEVTDLIARLADEIRTEEKFSLEMESLYIRAIVYLPPDEIEDYARKAYENDEIWEFSCVSGELPNEAVKDYCEKAYSGERVDFFSLLINVMPVDMKRDFCKRAYAEDRIEIFSILIDELRQDEIAALAETFYRNDEIAYFSITVSRLSKEKRNELMERARQDENEVIYNILRQAE